MYEKELEEIVRSAGAMLIENIGTLQITKKGRANFVTQMDVAVQEYIRKKLYELDPTVILLAEEQENAAPQPNRSYWILDPIDGTQNFIRHLGMSAIALAHYDSGVLQTGLVYNPFTEELFFASSGNGAFLNGNALSVTDTETLDDSLIVIGTSPYDRQFTTTNFALWQDIFEHTLDIRRTGSACLDLAYVAAGRFDGYFERNLKPWDMAAGILLVEESGGIVTDYRGDMVAVLKNSDICAGSPEIHKRLIKKIQHYWTI